MDWSTWAAVATILSGAGGWIVWLSTRLSRSEAKAESAAKEAAGSMQAATAIRLALEKSESKMREEIAKTERELVEHRVYVAREYVSNQTIAGLEEKLIKAIDRLGDRLDSLFAARQVAP